MKIAIICTGHPRTYERCLSNWKKAILDRFDVDYFFGVWQIEGTKLDNVPDNARPIPMRPTVHGDVSRNEIDKGRLFSNLCNFTHKQNIILFDPNEHNEIILNDIRNKAPQILKYPAKEYASWMGLPTTLWHQLYIMTRTYEKLVKTQRNKYDIIIRTRMDAAWVGLPKFNIKYNAVQVPYFHTDLPHDYLMWGNPDKMKEVFNIYNILPEMSYHYDDHGLVTLDAHRTFRWLYKNKVLAESNSTNVMSLIRKDSYPTRNNLDFLLEEKYSKAWRNPNINPGMSYDGVST